MRPGDGHDEFESTDLCREVEDLFPKLIGGESGQDAARDAAIVLFSSDEEDIGSDEALGAADGRTFEKCAAYKSRFWVSHSRLGAEKQ